MVTVVICNEKGREQAPDSLLPVNFFYSIICPKAATSLEMDAIESSR